MDVVHVACKLPTGLRLVGRSAAPEGSADRLFCATTERTGAVAVIAGSEYDRGAPAPERPGGYAVTLNVPRDLWENWLEANASSPIVRNRLVFADADLAALKARCKASAAVRSGLEPR